MKNEKCGGFLSINAGIILNNLDCQHKKVFYRLLYYIIFHSSFFIAELCSAKATPLLFPSPVRAEYEKAPGKRVYLASVPVSFVGTSLLSSPRGDDHI